VAHCLNDIRALAGLRSFVLHRAIMAIPVVAVNSGATSALLDSQLRRVSAGVVDLGPTSYVISSTNAQFLSGAHLIR
jgi:hypothetical protein